jgi:hypothetical protein
VNRNDVQAFRQCYTRWAECVSRAGSGSRASADPVGRPKTYSYGRKTEEYIADFELTANRHLHGEERLLFRVHFLLGADAKLCARQFHTSEPEVKLRIIAIENKLGKVFRELKPYSLWPVRAYFGIGASA